MNKLRRKIETRFIPGDPPVPPTPPVCTTTTKRSATGGRSGLSVRVRDGGGSSGGGSSGGGGENAPNWTIPVYAYREVNPLSPGPERVIVGWVSARLPGENYSTYGGSGGSGARLGGNRSSYTTTTTTTCTGGSPGKPGTPGRIEKIATGPDWQASARSIRRVSGNVVAAFNTGPTPRAALGFAVTDTGPTFGDLKMGVMFRRDGSANAVLPIINGQEQPVVGYYSPGDRVALIRAGGRFKIQVGGVTLYDAEATTEQPVVLDAMVYTSNDYVEDPAFATAEVAGTIRGSVGLRAKLSGTTGASGRVGLGGLVGTLVDGVAAVRVSGAVGLVGQVSAVSSDRVSVQGTVGLSGALTALADWAEVAAVLPAIAGVSSDRPYAQIDSVLPALGLSATGGAPTQNVAGADLSLPAYGFYALSYTGGLLSLEQDLPALTGVASDRPYGQASMTLPAVQMTADDGYTYPGYTLHIENVNLTDTIFPDPTLIASIEFGLEMQPSLSFATLVSGSYFDGLILDPSLSINAFMQALIESGINLSSATQAPKEGFGQYGFDLDSAAATRYEGFDFRGFAYTAGDTFAFRKDGVYRLRAGDDDGELRSALVDFGVTGMGTLGKKHIETVYLGMATDGRVYLKLTGDGGQEKTYRVIQRDPTYRVLTGRGATAREWSAKLEIVDSSSVELDDVEFVVAASGRKWVR